MLARLVVSSLIAVASLAGVGGVARAAEPTAGSAATAATGASAATGSAAVAVDTLRQRFPAGSIDSIEKADAALAATSGQKARVEKDYKDAARACIAKILVNACVDEARAERRRRNADIDAVELEANRFKRHDRAARADADRAKRDADREANAPADAALRERNRKAYEDKQAEASRSAADRARSDATRAASAAKPHGPPVKLGPLGGELTPAQREKNAADLAKRRQAAASHAKDIDRRVAEKAADRKRRDEAKAAKDAKTAAAAQAAIDAARSGVP